MASRHKHREHLKISINQCSERILFHSATVEYGALRLPLLSSSFASSALTTFPVGVSGMFETRNICDGRLYEARCRAAYSAKSENRQLRVGQRLNKGDHFLVSFD